MQQSKAANDGWADIEMKMGETHLLGSGQMVCKP